MVPANSSLEALLIRALPMMAWSADADLRVLRVEGPVLGALDIDAGQLVGTSLLAPPASDGLVPLEYATRVRAGSSVRYESDWRGRTFEVYLEPLCDEHGELRSVAGVALDVTTRALGLRRLHQSERSLAHAQRIARIGNWEFDLRTGELHWSDQIFDIFGLTRSEFAGDISAFFSRVHPDDQQRLLDAQTRVLRGETPLDIRHRIVLPDGSVRIVHESGELERDADGQPRVLRGVVHDVTERHLADVRIEQLNGVYTLLSAANRTIARERDIEALLDSVCRSAIEDGHFRAAWIGMRDESGSIRTTALAGVLQSAPGPAPRLEDSPLARVGLSGHRCIVPDLQEDDCERAWVREARHHGFRAFAVFPLIRRGQVLGAVGFFDDVPRFSDEEEVTLLEGLAADLAFALELDLRERERQRMEHALRDSMRELKLLSTRLDDIREQERARVGRDVHDHLGQALTALKLDIAEIRRRLVAPDLPAIATRLAEMTALIDSAIDDVRRVAAALMPLTLEESTLTEAMQAHLAEVARRSGLICKLHADVPALDVPTDRATALFRIMQEAVTNVVRHAQASRIDVDLGIKGDAVRLVVRDDGQGLAPSTARRPKPLGLESMRSRARLFGGSVEVQSSPGAGTTVTALLPSREAP